ncbi:response regulator [Anaerocolumna sedimenticola]|uniref:Stage 0 sporulation protein A homolog n=1 Tax=Anaerocolumna sedimenticola TaxID=2696063 RepID=A0A6P1TP39_9FIRM|nr:response regulator [Anaerocolumna sedimenticola]QHQ62754.1 response regulator [Anaerocolumna sedimenticola]
MKRVLIVDDASFMRMSIKNMLEKGGYEVAGEAGNGLEAVSKYKELKPDIVTMDITMPEMDGIEALKLIMQYDSKAKIIMVSAMGQETLVKQSILNGAKTFIIKPFKEEQVIQSLNKLTTI